MFIEYIQRLDSHKKNHKGTAIPLYIHLKYIVQVIHKIFVTLHIFKTKFHEEDQYSKAPSTSRATWTQVLRFEYYLVILCT